MPEGHHIAEIVAVPLVDIASQALVDRDWLELAAISQHFLDSGTVDGWY
jgi:L-asparaginase/Glu-tRNA(Gln) amidotransferase subunit D